MTLLPSVLIVDIHENRGEEIIKLITKIDESSIVKIQNEVLGFKWHIENKYYHADVNLCSSSLQNNFDEDFKNSVEAVVLFCDIAKENCIDDLNKCLNHLKTFCISERILLCKTCKALNETQKDAVSDWCIKNQYELVELEPEIEDECEFLPEAMGIDRVVEILQSHQWPNLIREEKNVHEIGSRPDTTSEESVIKTQVFENSNYGTHQNEDMPVNEDEFEDIEQMVTLFKNLQSMKNEISSLTTEQKLDQAEKVVKAFWNAVGGDADEFSDSDDNENICT